LFLPFFFSFVPCFYLSSRKLPPQEQALTKPSAENPIHSQQFQLGLSLT